MLIMSNDHTGVYIMQRNHLQPPPYQKKEKDFPKGKIDEGLWGICPRPP